MIGQREIFETVKMFGEEKLDVRTITMGISVLDCADSDMKKSCGKIYDKIAKRAENLVRTGEQIEKEYGIPIVNKRISVTPIAIVASACENANNFIEFAKTLDKAAETTGVNFIGGFSALVQKGFTDGDKKLIKSIPEALASTSRVCSSVNAATTKAGINMDAVIEM